MAIVLLLLMMMMMITSGCTMVHGCEACELQTYAPAKSLSALRVLRDLLYAKTYQEARVHNICKLRKWEGFMCSIVEWVLCLFANSKRMNGPSRSDWGPTIVIMIGETIGCLIFVQISLKIKQ